MIDFFSTQVGAQILGALMTMFGGMIAFFLQYLYSDRKYKKDKIYQDKLSCLKNLYANRSAMGFTRDESIRMEFNINLSIIPFVFDDNFKVKDLYYKFYSINEIYPESSNYALYMLFGEMYKDLSKKVPTFGQFIKILYLN